MRKKCLQRRKHEVVELQGQWPATIRSRRMRDEPVCHGRGERSRIHPPSSGCRAQHQDQHGHRHRRHQRIRQDHRAARHRVRHRRSKRQIPVRHDQRPHAALRHHVPDSARSSHPRTGRPVSPSRQHAGQRSCIAHTPAIHPRDAEHPSRQTQQNHVGQGADGSRPALLEHRGHPQHRPTWPWRRTDRRRETVSALRPEHMRGICRGHGHQRGTHADIPDARHQPKPAGHRTVRPQHRTTQPR